MRPLRAAFDNKDYDRAIADYTEAIQAGRRGAR
jgi:hypothetical protein